MAALPWLMFIMFLADVYYVFAAARSLLVVCLPVTPVGATFRADSQQARP
jgi:hypothetical protein